MSEVLMLNKNWVPVNVVSCKKAVHKVFNGRALFLDTDTYATYDYESWLENWGDAAQLVRSGKKIMKTVKHEFLRPEVIICTEYGGVGFKITHSRPPKFSRGNVYRRDRHQCLYCGHKFKTEDLTIDHIIPKSKGGKMEWMNVVLACVECNNKKGNLSITEAGMRLVRKPFKPTEEDLRVSPMQRLRYKMGKNPPKIWDTFMGRSSIDKAMSDLYWNVELKE